NLTIFAVMSRGKRRNTFIESWMNRSRVELESCSGVSSPGLYARSDATLISAPSGVVTVCAATGRARAALAAPSMILSLRPISPLQLFWQRKGDHRLVVGRPAIGTAYRRSAQSRPGGKHPNTLLSVLAAIGDRHRHRRVLEPLLPQHLAVVRIEGAEEPVGRRTDEHQTTRGHDRPAEGVVRTGVLLAFGQILADPQPARPGDLAGVRVHRHQLAPGRADAR